jgi:GNAT superfamily N-acetyltransferase
MAPSPGAVRLDRVIEALPAGFETMRAEALAEGYRFLERLAADWESGALRFTKAGEVLLAAYSDGVLAGIGGVTVDPVIPEALRMRRFYIRERFRRHGIGQQLALALLAQPVGRDGPVTVNAAAGSAPFWEALGFIRDAPDTPICFPLSRINKIVALIIFNC